MNIIVDTNIVISALINPKGREFGIIIKPLADFSFYSAYFLYVEILKHKEKVLKYSRLSEDQFLEMTYKIFRRISFINEDDIPLNIRQQAIEITKPIDEKDSPFVSLAIYLDGILWTGDKKLYKGLKDKSAIDIMNTEELYQF